MSIHFAGIDENTSNKELSDAVGMLPLLTQLSSLKITIIPELISFPNSLEVLLCFLLNFSHLFFNLRSIKHLLLNSKFPIPIQSLSNYHSFILPQKILICVKLNPNPVFSFNFHFLFHFLLYQLYWQKKNHK